MSTCRLSAFTPFSLQLGSRRPLHYTVQQAINYGESRFRRILLAVVRANEKDRKWMQQCLREELAVILSFVGVAASTGQVIEIPIIIRSLSDSLSFVDPKYLPLSIDSSLLAVLNAGVPFDSPFALVEDYKFTWWTGEKSPTSHNKLNTGNLADAIEYHWEQLTNKKFLMWPTPPGPDSRGRDEARPACPMCLPHQSTAGDLLAELQSIWRSAQAAETSAQSALQCTIRRASGFYSLYEHALNKEHSVATLDDLASCVDGQAEPRTWGAQLTGRDLEELAATLQHLRLQHSGYGHKLPYGRDLKAGVESKMPPGPPTAARGPSFPSEVKEPASFITDPALYPPIPTSLSKTTRAIISSPGPPIKGVSRSSPSSSLSKSFHDLNSEGDSMEDSDIEKGVERVESEVLPQKTWVVSVGLGSAVMEPKSLGTAAAQAWASDSDQGDQKVHPQGASAGSAAAAAWNEDGSEDEAIESVHAGRETKEPSAGVAAAMAWGDDSSDEIEFVGSDMTTSKRISSAAGATAGLWDNDSDEVSVDESDAVKVVDHHARGSGKTSQFGYNAREEKKQAGQFKATWPAPGRTIQGKGVTGTMAVEVWLSDTDDDSEVVKKMPTADDSAVNNSKAKFGYAAAAAWVTSDNDADTEEDFDGGENDSEDQENEPSDDEDASIGRQSDSGTDVASYGQILSPGRVDLGPAYTLNNFDFVDEPHSQSPESDVGAIEFDEDEEQEADELEVDP